MIKRTVSAFVAVALLVAVLFVSDEYKYIFNTVVSILAVVSVWEIFHATKFLAHKSLTAASLMLAAFLPFASTPLLRPFAEPVIFVYIVFVLYTMLRKKEVIALREISLAFMVTVLVAFAFSTLVGLRDLGMSAQTGFAKRDGVFLLLMAVACSSLADTGAYFTGSLLGKHKLAPTISPKKSVEGFIGGIVFNVLGMLGLAVWYQNSFSAGATLNLPLVMLIAFVASFLGTLGDLSASYIKRSCEIKDFGNIIPGHGGIMDRFDSILMVAPFVYLTVVQTLDIWPLIVR